MRTSFPFLLILLFVLGLRPGTAQDLPTALKKMRDRYTQIQRYGTEVQIDIYEADRLLQSKRAAIKKDQYHSYYHLDRVKMLLNDRFSILVNDQEKVIVMHRHEGKLKNVFEEWRGMDPEQIEALLENYEDWEFVAQEEGQQHYRLFDADGLIQRIDLFIDAEEHSLKRLVYQYQPQGNLAANRVVVQYQNQRFAPQWSAGTFSEKQFVYRKGGQWHLQATYRDYELIEPRPLSDE